VVLEVTRTEEKVGVAGTATTTTVAAGGTPGSCGNSSPEVRAVARGQEERRGSATGRMLVVGRRSWSRRRQLIADHVFIDDLVPRK